MPYSELTVAGTRQARKRWHDPRTAHVGLRTEVERLCAEERMYICPRPSHNHSGASSNSRKILPCFLAFLYEDAHCSTVIALGETETTLIGHQSVRTAKECPIGDKTRYFRLQAHPCSGSRLHSSAGTDATASRHTCEVA
eukprot:scaffold2323_cov329-Prasinococcus_capsulatus_cf.AAC.6